jgi:hypothetical protein
MKFLEKDLETIIYKHKEICCERGLYECFPGEHSQLFRQVKLGRYGVADLIAVDFTHNIPVSDLGVRTHRKLRINIIECKLKEINITAYLQAKRYKTAIKQLLKRYNLKNTRIDFHIVLVGKTLDDVSDFVFQLNDDYGCSVYTYEYGPNGIEFTDHENGWKLPNGIPHHCQSNAPSQVLPILKASFLQWYKEYQEDMEGYWEYRRQRDIDEALNSKKD